MSRSLAITAAVLIAFAAFTAGAPTPASAQSGVGSVTIMQSCSNGEPFCFSPPTLTVADGTTITWSNQTGIAHTVTRCDPGVCGGVPGGTGTDATFTTANVDASSGATFTHTFNGPGTYNYYCAIHGYALMHGTITVTAATPTTTTPTTTTTGSTATGSPPTTSAPSRAASSPSPAINPSATPTTTAKQLPHTGGTTRTQLAAVVVLVSLGLALIALTIRRRRPLT